MKFLPDDTAALDAMYQAMSQCQALNPDPDAQQSDSDPENIFLDADGDADDGNEDEGECEGRFQHVSLLVVCNTLYFFFKLVH